MPPAVVFPARIGRRDERVIAVLRSLISSDADAAVRLMAVEATLGLEPERTRALLRLAMNDQDEQVRNAAKAALQAMAGSGGGGRPGGRRNGTGPPEDR